MSVWRQRSDGSAPAEPLPSGTTLEIREATLSRDGQWLVYHVYSRNLVAPDAGAWAGHYSIFKVNVNTGETTKLLDGGYSPSWRWPVGEP